MICPNCSANVSDGKAFCTSCGTALGATGTAPPAAGGVRSTMGSPSTSAGTPQGPGADFADQGATPSGVPGFAAPPPGPGAPGGPGEAPPAPGQGSGAAPGQRRGGVLKVFAVVGVVALIAGVVWFVRGMTSSSGGASSPEAAVEQLASALDAEDPAGVAAALAPDEVRALGQVVEGAEKQARSAGLAQEKDTYAGLDVTVSDLDLEVDELGPNTARVTIRSGEVTYDTKPGDMAPSVAAAVRDEDLAGGEISARSFESDTGLDVGRDPFLITVKRDGGWYVSLAYSAAEYLVRNNDRPDGDFGEELEPEEVAEDPEEAVYTFAESVGNLQVDEAASSVSQPEWSVLHAYRDAIEDAIEREQDDGNLVNVDFQIDDADLKVEDLSDDAKRVVIDSAEGSYSWTGYEGDESRDWEVQNGCLQLGEDDPTCLDDGTFLTRQLALEDPYVVVVREGDGWVVSPMSTAIEYGKQLVPTLTAPTVLALLGRPQNIEPTGKLDSGDPTEVTLNEAGYATYTLTPSADSSFVLQYEDLDEVTVFDESGDALYGDYFGGAAVYDLGQETYTVVAERSEYDGGSSGTINLNRLRVEDLPASGAASGRLTTAQPVIEYRFQVSESQARSVELETTDEDGYTEAAIIDEAGDSVCSSDFDLSCDLSSGENYRLRVANYEMSSDSLQFDVRVEEDAGVSIDGAAEVSGYLADEEHAYHTVVVPEGMSATIYVTSSGDVDGYTDVMEDGDTGDVTLFITGPYTGTLDVFMYSGPADYTASIVED